MLGKLNSVNKWFSRCTLGSGLLKVGKPTVVSTCRSYTLVPRTQYWEPWLHHYNIFKVAIKHWELSPLMTLLVFDIILFTTFPIYSFFNKVDVNWTPGKRNHISRTMDLRCPDKHKLLVINQKYEPWPEMQDVLDGMAKAEIQMELRKALESRTSGNERGPKDCRATKKDKGDMC